MCFGHQRQVSAQLYQCFSQDDDRPVASTEPWTKIWSKPLSELVELNSAFSTILPYVLSEKLKIEFQDVDGAALNASAIVAENYLMESTPQVDLRVVQPIKMHL